MEIRVLRYFVAVVNEGNITAAAEKLHLSQPTLSKQLMALEEELGKTLFMRGKKTINLTEEGQLLHKRALEIISLVDRTEKDLQFGKQSVSGDVFIGVGDISALSFLARAVKRINDNCPDIRFNLVYGDASELTEKLDHGLIDFTFYVGAFDQKKYSYLRLPLEDRWGIITRKGGALSQLARIRPADLRDIPLAITRQTMNNNSFSSWLGCPISRLNIVTTFDLAHIVVPLVEQGFCSALILERKDKNVWGENVVFVPLSPAIIAPTSLAWNKTQPLSAAAELFLSELKGLTDEAAEKEA